MRSPRQILVPALLAVLLAGGACGDDGDGDDADDAAAAPASGSAPTDGTDGTEDTESDGDDGGEGAQASAEFCARAEELATDESLDELDISDADDAATASQLLRAFADLAPSEVAEDIRVIADSYPELSAAFAEMAGDEDAGADDFAELEERFAGLEAAGERVETFVRDACGVDLSE